MAIVNNLALSNSKLGLTHIHTKAVMYVKKFLLKIIVRYRPTICLPSLQLLKQWLSRM